MSFCKFPLWPFWFIYRGNNHYVKEKRTFSVVSIFWSNLSRDKSDYISLHLEERWDNVTAALCAATLRKSMKFSSRRSTLSESAPPGGGNPNNSPAELPFLEKLFFPPHTFCESDSPYWVTKARQLSTTMGTTFLVSCWSLRALPSVPAAREMAECHRSKSVLLKPWM